MAQLTCVAATNKLVRNGSAGVGLLSRSWQALSGHHNPFGPSRSIVGFPGRAQPGDLAGVAQERSSSTTAAATSMQTSEGLKLGDDSAVRSSVSKYYGEVRARLVHSSV
jgi:hypothetical protein